MKNYKLKRIITLVLVLIITLTSGFVFADDKDKASNNNTINAQELFKEEATSSEVKDGTEKIIRPWVKVAAIGIAIFGMVIIVGTIWFLGSEAWKMIRSRNIFDMKVFYTFVMGIVIGVLFTGAGVFDVIGFTDNLVANTILKIFDASQ